MKSTERWLQGASCALVVGVAAASLQQVLRLGGEPPFVTSAQHKQGQRAGEPRVRLLATLDDARLTLPVDDRWLSTAPAPNVALSPAPTRNQGARARRLTRTVSLTSDAPGAASRTDRREALLVAASAEVRFSLTPSAGTRLDVAPAPLSALSSELSFKVQLRPRGGRWSTLDAVRLGAPDVGRWHDRTIDLSAFAGVPVELALTTSCEPADAQALATWGAPTLVETKASAAGVNVVWISIDGMRPDVLSAWHTPKRDAQLAQAAHPPLEAWLPAMPSVAPAIDALARTGAAFIDTTSVATTSRSGAIAAMAGARASELGLDTSPRELPAATLAHHRATRPALLPDLLRERGLVTQEIACAPTGPLTSQVERGFDQTIERAECSGALVDEAIAWVQARTSERFFLHLRLDLPTWLGPSRPPTLPALDPLTRAYLGALSGIDDALSALLSTLSTSGLARNTLIVLSAAHGQTLSRAHDARIALLDEPSTTMRGNAEASMFDETTRVPLILSLPGRISADQKLDSPVLSSDVMPTVLELLGEAVPESVRGQSLLPLLEGGPADRDRILVSEGRAARSVRIGRYRYVERDEGAMHLRPAGEAARDVREELYDLQGDPGERDDLSQRRPDEVATMRAALADALASSTSFGVLQSESLAGSRHQLRSADAPVKIAIRLAAGGAPKRFTLSAWLDLPAGAAHPPTLRASAYQTDEELVRVEGTSLDASLTAASDGLVGVDLELWPPSTPIHWAMTLDDHPLTADLLFAGPHGLRAPMILDGLLDEAALITTDSATPAWVDASRETGVFITRTLATSAPPLLHSGNTADHGASPVRATGH